MRLIILCLSLFLCFGCSDRTSQPAPAFVQEEGFRLSWEDHFDRINPEYWTLGLRDPESGDLVPGARGRYLLNEHYDAYFTEEDVYTEEGLLHLRNQKRKIKGTDPEGAFEYSSGWLMSMHKVFFKEGYLEVRAQFPSGDKVWPAIWLIPEDLTWCPEWDLFEYFGYREDQGFDQMGMHLCSSPWPDQEWADYFLADFDKTFDGEAWHTYGFVWTEEYAAWYIDGKEMRRLEAKGIAAWPDKDMYIVLNNGTRTESPDSNTVWPNHLKVDYIQLYTK